MKKKYYRLRNGNFLSLEHNEDIEFLNNLTEVMDIDLKSINNGNIKHLSSIFSHL